MKKFYLSFLRTMSVFFLLTVFTGTLELNAQSVQNDLISTNISLIKSGFFNLMNVMTKGDLVLPDSAVQFEHPSNAKMAVVSFSEYDEHGNAYVIETYDYITKTKSRIEYKYGTFPYYHGIYEYNRPLEWKAYIWEGETYLLSAHYKYTYDSNGKLTHHEIYQEDNTIPTISCEVETKTDAQNRIISEDYDLYPGAAGMLWKYEYGANGKISKWTTDSYAIIVGVTGSSIVTYTSYNSYGLNTERIVEGVQMGVLASRTKEKMFYENEKKIVRGETWKDNAFNSEFTMSSYDIFYYGGSGSGITETKNDLKIEVYPSPTTGKLIIDNNNGACPLVNVEIYDVFGRKVFEKFPSNVLEGWQPQADGVVIDLTLFPSGTYFVRIVTEQGVEVKKVIKN